MDGWMDGWVKGLREGYKRGVDGRLMKMKERGTVYLGVLRGRNCISTNDAKYESWNKFNRGEPSNRKRVNN